jgi:hypothetical protein
MTSLVRSLKSFNLLLALCLCALCLPGCSPSINVLCSVDDLIQRINEANSTPATVDTLELSAGCFYGLDVTNNKLDGANGLPIINSSIIIIGHGATIARNPGNPDHFRIFYIAGMGDLTLNDLTLTGGYSFNPEDPANFFSNSGGAIYNRGELVIERSRIERNFASNNGEGGAILNIGTLEISNSTFDGNEGGRGQGGAFLSNWGEATITGSTVSRNGLLEDQDAIWTQGTLSMTNSTISGNGGSGINNDFGDVHLNYVTIAYNPRFGMSGSSGHWYVTNSLLAFNGRGACTPTLPLSSPSSSNIMDTDGTCGGLTVPEADVRLSPLGNYGGLTETHALGVGSAAIDVVAPQSGVYTHLVPGCIPTDQRGEPRPYGSGCDLGAYEYSGEQGTPAPLLAPPVTPTVAPCTFTAVVDLNCRSGPGALLYPVVDGLEAGESAEVVGQSVDGLFVYLVAPHTSGVCAVSADPGYGTLAGACDSLAVFTPLPVPTATFTPVTPPGGSSQYTGCTVWPLVGGPVKCIVPCPTGAVPGEPCNP